MSRKWKSLGLESSLGGRDRRKSWLELEPPVLCVGTQKGTCVNTL